MDALFRGIKKGFFRVENPFTRAIRMVPATPDRVAAIVFWSKDYGRFLEKEYGNQLLEMGFSLFFQFTVNTQVPELEPRMPTLSDRLDQMEALADRFGPDAVSWRFDPICHWQNREGETFHNLTDFPLIATRAAKAGLGSCTTSFLDLYPKVIRRGKRFGIFFTDPPMERKHRIIERMHRFLSPLTIQLELCCEPDLTPPQDDFHKIKKAACIPGDHLHTLCGPVSRRKDPGQRKGCGCTQAMDIGSYTRHPCGHDCRYCYATPETDTAIFQPSPRNRHS